MRIKLSILVYLLTTISYAQEICPVEDVNVFGGDGQNIISWSEPGNPFVSTFSLELTTDQYGYETSWDLVDEFGCLFGCISKMFGAVESVFVARLRLGVDC